MNAMFDILTLSNLPQLIRQKMAALDDRMRKNRSHVALTPDLAYGRHRGPAPRYAHPAAVLVTLVPITGSEWTIPLTLRPTQMADHGGQVSLPGGRSDSGETVWQTACREFAEELGCTTESLQLIGQLKPVYVYASRHMVTPMVGVCATRPSFRPNPDEVAELIFMPLKDLISDEAISVGTMRKGNVQFEAPGFRIGEHFVWGATAMVLADLRDIVCSIVLEHK